MSYPKSKSVYYRSAFWWNEEKPWFVETRYSATNGLPHRQRFSTHEEAKEWLDTRQKCGITGHYWLKKEVMCDNLYNPNC